jgi:hypothetical protein
MEKDTPRYQDILSHRLGISYIVPTCIIAPYPSVMGITPPTFRYLSSLDLLSTRSFCLQCQHLVSTPEYCSCSSYFIPHPSMICISTLVENTPQPEPKMVTLPASLSPSKLIFPRAEQTNIMEIVSCKRINSSGQCESPFRIVDEYVLHVAGLNPDPQLGPIRITQWNLKSCASMPHNPREIGPPEVLMPTYIVTYQITGTKYCHRIGRHHKSNHIMFEVNLNQGYIVQKCWDPDCRGFKSSPFYIPHRSLLTMNEIQEIIGDIVLARSLSEQTRK